MAFEDAMMSLILLVVGLILGNMYAKLKVVMTEYGIDEMFNRARTARRERKEQVGVAE